MTGSEARGKGGRVNPLAIRRRVEPAIVCTMNPDLYDVQ